MKKALAITMALFVAVSAVAGVYIYDLYKAPPRPFTNPQTCNDPATISGHVYNPGSLQLVKSCIAAAGIVQSITPEADGDVRMSLTLDPPYGNLTTPGNDYEGGDLVVQIVCVNTPTQADAVAHCQNYTNNIPVPALGQHILLTGPYVKNTDHYNWAEIHPVYSLTLPSGTTGVIVSTFSLAVTYQNSPTGWLVFNQPTDLPIQVSGGDYFTETLTLNNTSTSAQNITAISVSTPGFSLLSEQPSLPVTFNADESLSVTLTILTPDVNYTGAIGLKIAAS